MLRFCLQADCPLEAGIVKSIVTSLSETLVSVDVKYRRTDTRRSAPHWCRIRCVFTTNERSPRYQTAGARVPPGLKEAIFS